MEIVMAGCMFLIRNIIVPPGNQMVYELMYS